MTNDNYIIRQMVNIDEVRFAINLARVEGWNPGIHDAESFYTADPNGFRIGLLNGIPISCISTVRYGDSYGFLGLYIVKPKYRKKKYGVRIWNEGLKYLDGRDVGLDGVLQQESDYMKSGFVTAYYNSRFEGKANRFIEPDLDPRIIELSRLRFEDLIAYDSMQFPVSRVAFLESWITRPQSIGLGVLENGKLSGYAVLRRCFVGYKIGPLFADNEEIAEALFQALSSRVRKGAKLFLDVPGEKENPAATALARRHGMTKVFDTARMYRMAHATKMKLPLERCFGVTSFELG